MNIHLVIAITGDYPETKETWVVEAFTDEAAAFAEADRLNVAQPILEELSSDYDKKFWTLRVEAADKLPPRGPQHTPRDKYGQWHDISLQDQNLIDADIYTRIGIMPEYPADEYTVMSIPIGEHGRWELP